MEICNMTPVATESGFNGPVKVLEKGVLNGTKNTAAEMSVGDTISVSRDGLFLTEAMRAAQTAPDVRADKVAEIKSRLEAGTYNIDSGKLAAAIVSEDLALFRAQ